MISPNPLMSGLIILRVQFNVLVDGPQPNSGILIINLLDDITLLHVPPVKKKIVTYRSNTRTQINYLTAKKLSCFNY